MQRPDIIRIEDMLDAAREAVTFTAHQSCTDLDANRMLVLAVVMAIEIG